jgi:hypothetical protein
MRFVTIDLRPARETQAGVHYVKATVLKGVYYDALYRE